jgi:hypothetical protein
MESFTDFLETNDRRLNPWPEPSSSSEKWRYVTFDQLFYLKDHREPTHGVYRSAKNSLIHELIDCFEPILVEDPSKILIDIVELSYTLVIAMGKQRCRLRLVIPERGVEFDSKRQTHLCSMKQENRDPLDHGFIDYVITPALIKWGDAHGSHLDTSMTVYPCTVHVAETIVDHPRSK